MRILIIIILLLFAIAFFTKSDAQKLPVSEDITIPVFRIVPKEDKIIILSEESKNLPQQEITSEKEKLYPPELTKVCEKIRTATND